MPKTPDRFFSHFFSPNWFKPAGALNPEHIEPGTIADIPRGMQYVQPPGAGNAAGFIDIQHACLRGAGCRWNAPE